MTAPNIINRRLHSPHFICVRDAQRIGDIGVLNCLGIANYQRLVAKKPRGHYVVLFDAADWTVVADSWFYNLWHSPQTKIAIDTFARDYDVYVCSVGECDLSYAFEYHRDGGLIRKKTVESPHFDDRIVTDNFGDLLPTESTVWSRDIDDSIRIQLLGESIGIPSIVVESQREHLLRRSR